ncbi:ribosome biogenesis protein [Candidatus Woesearchaeota archaeon]|nr:ribosome biogenesis protein [Candidatus Woesearchaeota archaeon]
MNHILRCPSCKSYGLSEQCSCGGTRVKPKPPKYSPEDKYGVYRRKVKEIKEEESQPGV